MYTISLLLIVIGHLADYLSTRYALERGAHEMNPIVRAMGLEVNKVVVTGLTAAVLVLFPPVAGLLAAIGTCTMLLMIAAHNVYTVRKVK